MSKRVLDYISTRVEVSAAEIYREFGYNSESGALHMLHKMARRGLLESRFERTIYINRWASAQLKLFRVRT